MQIQNLNKFSWIRLLAIILLILGISWRFLALERKVYWHDEAFTSTVITGRPGEYLNTGIFRNQIVKPAALLSYQQFQPNLSLQDCLVRQGNVDPQHPPLYYILLRLWCQVWGTSVTATRSFSALLSLLLFPSIYLLCQELFASAPAGWLAVAFVAVSPLQLAYAQEAREYALWMGLMILSSALLLRALRLATWKHWLLYGVTLLVGLYTALFTLLVMLGHLAYVLPLDSKTTWRRLPPRPGPQTRRLLLVLLGTVVLFLPWVYVTFRSATTLAATTSWASVPLPWWITLQAHISNFSRSFVDFNLGFGHPLTYALGLPVLGLQVYAVYRLWRTAPRRIWWFVLTLFGGTALVLGVRDLLRGGQLLTVTRYLFPCVIAGQLAVVYLLTKGLCRPSPVRYRQPWRTPAALILVMLIGLGIASCSVYSQSQTWWNKVLNSNYPQVAEVINRHRQPLVIADAYGYNPASLISLSYLLKPETDLLLMPAVGKSLPIQSLPARVGQIYLLNLPPEFRQQFEQKFRYKLTSVFHDPWNELWQAEPSLQAHGATPIPQ